MNKDAKSLLVPVVHPKQHSFVDKAVREESLRVMAGIAEDTAKDPQEDSTNPAALEAGGGPGENGADSAPTTNKELVKHVSKRKLYRQATGEEVIWFPHDNAPALMKEFVHESGRGCWEARWVFHGTPAGSTGVQGVLETGCSVVALCENEHHATNVRKHLREHCVEALLAGSVVFADQDLTARASKLWPTAKKEKGAKEEKEAAKKEKEQEGKEKENDDEQGTENTPKKGKAKNRKRKRTSTSSSSSTSSSAGSKKGRKQ